MSTAMSDVGGFFSGTIDSIVDWFSPAPPLVEDVDVVNSLLGQDPSAPLDSLLGDFAVTVPSIEAQLSNIDLNLPQDIGLDLDEEDDEEKLRTGLLMDEPEGRMSTYKTRKTLWGNAPARRSTLLGGW